MAPKPRLAVITIRVLVDTDVTAILNAIPNAILNKIPRQKELLG